PRLELVGAGDEMLAALAPLVRDGKVFAEPAPYDDPMSFYESDPDVRVSRWLQSVWRGRGRFSPSDFRLAFAVLVDGEAVGMQDLIAEKFDSCGTFASFSWLSTDVRGRGHGTEMRSALLHLAFAGLRASEAAVPVRSSTTSDRTRCLKPWGTSATASTGASAEASRDASYAGACPARRGRPGGAMTSTSPESRTSVLS
ncbi:hypothetical protein BAURA86_04110, partial [Brevibacterium aurantiacum]